MRLRFFISVVATATIAMATTGCAQGEAAEIANIVDSDTYVELYQETVVSFPEHLPDGMTFPDTPPPMEGEIGRGNAAGAAYFYWVCAWEDIYLTKTDSSTRQTAMDAMRKFPQTEWGSRYYDDPDNVWGATLDAAELGDLTELRAFHESDCSFYRTGDGA
ncbi:hypothetical protein WDU99_09055 [Microbacterium sp. Mu-80]|uniref:Lipoprotein n=1 Tax=Microbacterium bandirmense TaxID=3122050 RepID=A0ABU8LAW1_9MICO